MRHYRVMIIEKDPVIRKFLRANLEARYYETLTAPDGPSDILRLVHDEDPDLVILDVAPTNGVNLDLCRSIREVSPVPVVVLSLRNDEAWKVKCLDAGADDFITRPFGVEELMAQVRAALRRTDILRSAPLPLSWRNGKLEIRFTERRVTVSAREVRLTPTEYNLLQELALNGDRVLTHNDLLNKVWGPEYNEAREYLRVFIGRLRRKLEVNPRKPSYIITVPWVGYKLSTNPEPAAPEAAALAESRLAPVGSR